MLPKISSDEDSAKDSKRPRRKSTRLMSSLPTTSDGRRSKRVIYKHDTSETSSSSSSERGAKKKRQTSSDRAAKEPANSDFESEASSRPESAGKEEGSEEEEVDKVKVNRRKRQPKKKLAVKSDESDESDEEEKETRRRLRKVIDDKKLDKTTLDALAAEQERRKRIEEKRKEQQKAQDSEINLDDSIQLDKTVVESESPQKASQTATGLFLDVTKSGEKRVKVDDRIARILKPHQIDGVQFMWDSCFENIEMIAKNDEGSGCVLAHCMGLGKTLQVVALVHTLINNQAVTKVSRVLVLLPVNVQINWRSEFKKWTAGCKRQLEVFDLGGCGDKGMDVVKARVKVIESWVSRGGVFLIGYTMFARLVQGVGVKSKALKERLLNGLTGPDVVVCDEGHLLKSEKTNVSKAVNQVKTKRRIVLTGTPLQNNLVEYHCMVSFVKPSLVS